MSASDRLSIELPGQHEPIFDRVRDSSRNGSMPTATWTPAPRQTRDPREPIIKPDRQRIGREFPTGVQPLTLRERLALAERQAVARGDLREAAQVRARLVALQNFTAPRDEAPQFAE